MAALRGKKNPNKQKKSEQILTSAVKYSRMAAEYTAAVAPTRPWLVVLFLRCLCILPTGNYKKIEAAN